MNSVCGVVLACVCVQQRIVVMEGHVQEGREIIKLRENSGKE